MGVHESMKRIVLFLTIIVCLFVMISSCKNDEKCDNIRNENNIETSIASELKNTEYDLLPSFENSESQQRFKKLILNNSIDKEYFSNDYDHMTMQDLVQHEERFVDIWRSEFEFSYMKYAELLNGNSKDNFIAAQKQWYDSIIESHSIVFKATEFVWSDLKREATHELLIDLRTHTLYIKYYEYIYHQINDPDMENTVEFQFQVDDN